MVKKLFLMLKFSPSYPLNPIGMRNLEILGRCMTLKFAEKYSELDYSRNSEETHQSAGI